MNIIIKSTIITLQKSQYLLDSITDEQLCNDSVSPYHSSIGSHIRHILDFYGCVLNIDSDNQIDLTARPRNKDVESKCNCAYDYLNSIIDKLNNLDFNMHETISVIDDLGLGKIEIPYTFSALFAQGNSHTIHHYAIINYIVDRLGIALHDANFGYNPTTPKQASIN